MLPPAVATGKLRAGAFASVEPYAVGLQRVGVVAKTFKYPGDKANLLIQNSLDVAAHIRAFAESKGRMPPALRTLPFTRFGNEPTVYAWQAPGVPLAEVPNSAFADQFNAAGGVGSLFEMLAAQLTEAIVFLRDAGVGHGDMHRFNIIFDVATGRAGIVDWDLALMGDDAQVKDKMFSDAMYVRKYLDEIADYIKRRYPAHAQRVSVMMMRWGELLMPTRERGAPRPVG